MKNILIVLSGPSGVGKGTLVEEIMKERADIVKSVSCTTRAPRAGERDKEDYFFISRESFGEKIASGGFLEYDEHFHNFYGTPKAFVEERLKEKSVLLEIDVKGALSVKKSCPSAVLVMIAPPSLQVLKERLCGRGTESGEQIENRVARAAYELAQSEKYDYVVVNDDLQEAKKRLLAIIDEEKNKA